MAPSIVKARTFDPSIATRTMLQGGVSFSGPTVLVVKGPPTLRSGRNVSMLHCHYDDLHASSGREISVHIQLLLGSKMELKL